MKKRYSKPTVRLVKGNEGFHLLTGSTPTATFDVGTNLDGLGGYDGGSNGQFAD